MWCHISSSIHLHWNWFFHCAQDWLRAPAWQHVLILISGKSWILLIISTQNNPVGWEVFSSMAAIYTSSFLRSLSSSIQTNNHLAPDLWQRLTSLGLSRVKPTRRGLRGGNRRRQVLPRPGTVLESSMGQPLSSYGSFLADFPGEKVNLNGESNLHTAPSSTLNIQIDTLQRVGINNGSIPVIKPRNRLQDRPSGPQRPPGMHGWNLSRFAPTIPSNQGKENSVFGLSALLANTMSLAPKIDEVRSVVLDLKPNLGFFTETWLRETICDSLLQIPGYSFIHRDRTTDHHGGVGLYIENSIKFKHLEKLSDPDIEALWAWLRPSRLPRGVPCIVVGVIYHPHFA